MPAPLMPLEYASTQRQVRDRHLSVETSILDENPPGLLARDAGADDVKPFDVGFVGFRIVEGRALDRLDGNAGRAQQ